LHRFALILVYQRAAVAHADIATGERRSHRLTAPHIGKLVDRKGERGPLTFYSIGLIVVFLATPRRAPSKHSMPCSCSTTCSSLLVWDSRLISIVSCAKAS
jgi:hypothetical protein